MKRNKEITIGVLAIVAFFLGYVGLNYLKGINLFSKETVYYTELSNVGGVSVATSVTIGGYKVGSVRLVDFAYDPSRGYGAKVTLDIKPEVRIPKGSSVKVKTNVLSGAELVISTPAGATEFLEVGSTIASEEASADIMSAVSDRILPSIEEALPALTSILKRLQALSESQAIDSVIVSLRHTTTNIEGLTAQLQQSTKMLPQTMGNVHSFSTSLVQVGQEMEKLKVDTLLHNLNATTSSLQAVMGQLTATDNTAGLLLNDPQLYHRLDSLVHSADELLKDLKAHPKRYVKLSLF